MTFTIEKLGRINAAQIEIKPLTLFVGKNDSGKTYCASAIWALLTFVQGIGYPSALKNVPEQLKIIEQYLNDQTPSKLNIKFSSEQIHQIQKDVRQSFAKASPKLLSDAIGYEGFSHSKFNFLVPENCVQEMSIVVGVKKDTDVEQLILIENEDDEDGLVESVSHNYSTTYELMIDGQKIRAFDINISELQDVFQLLKYQLGQDIAGYAVFGKESSSYKNTIYLPAARTGIMLGIDFFVSGTMQRNLLDPNRTKAPQASSLPAPLREFAANLTSPYRVRYQSDQFLGKILNGSYARTKKRGEYQYTPLGMENPIPLAATSSLVTELAGFALMLNTVDMRDSFVIFEEPEAHLHLEAQREIAKVLVALANKGRRLLITTHSDTFLQQINNLIALNDHPAREDLLAKLEIDVRETINRSNVIAYDFKCVNNVTNVERLVCGKSGFVAPSLNEVLMRLSLETIAIQQDLDESEEGQ